MGPAVNRSLACHGLTQERLHSANERAFIELKRTGCGSFLNLSFDKLQVSEWAGWETVHRDGNSEKGKERV